MDNPRYSLAVRKWDVIDTLRRQHGLHSLAQILTPSTGRDMHGRPELARFGAVTTLMYAGEPIQRDIEDTRQLPTLDELIAWRRANPLEVELVFIDCWHSYDDSVRVLELALSMLPRGGFIVMHDCDPPDAEVAGPAPEHGGGEYWCGDSWRAFVDVTASLVGCEWFVVESDFGIGVITVAPPRRTLLKKRRIRRKKQAPEGHEAGWNWLVEHRSDVLHPMSIADWQRRATTP